jgi:integrase
MSKQIALTVRLSLVTGQRSGKETTQAAKAEFDLNGPSPTWEIPKSRTKNDESHRVPLSALAVRLVKEAMELAGESAYLFPSPTDLTDDKPIDAHAPTRAMSRARGDDEWSKPLKEPKQTYKGRGRTRSSHGRPSPALASRTCASTPCGPAQGPGRRRPQASPPRCVRVGQPAHLPAALPSRAGRLREFCARRRRYRE